MRNWRVFFWIGLGFFVLGGVLLAFMEGEYGTGVGTTMGLAGAGLMIWAWVSRQAGQ